MDKELALIIAEMPIKQDETTAQLRNVASEVKTVAAEVKETNSILKDFMAISVKQWEQQH